MNGVFQFFTHCCIVAIFGFVSNFLSVFMGGKNGHILGRPFYFLPPAHHAGRRAIEKETGFN